MTAYLVPRDGIPRRIALVSLDLEGARREALLTRQRWLPDGDAPESVLLRDARAAIARTEGRL